MAHQGWFYHVFLSFRGEDTRKTFAGNLYSALDQRGINTFIDNEALRVGEEISPSLLKAIEESRISIIIFSKNYASSSWCLDELVKILECRKEKGQMVCAVFYNVSPADVRHQKGSYGEAFVKHEERFKHDMERVRKWRSALSEAANLSGWHFTNGYEYKFIQTIVDEVSQKLNRIPLNVARHPVGLQARVSEVYSLLEPGSDDVRMVGIYGIGGIGKTTIVKAVYNTLCDQFRYASFLANVRENTSHRSGLVKLQERLLYEILGEKATKLGNVDIGINIIKDRLCRKRVLLVIDNVDDVDQLQALAGGLDWFGPGSRIIITTRDKHLLTAHQVDLTYEVKKLNHHEALQLFSWNAFKRSEPDASYFHIANRAVAYAEGLPLALTVLGSDMCGRSIRQWESALDKYKRSPNRKVQNILRISFDGLDENEKEIFLYIACFFKGQIMEYVVKALRACDLHPAIGIAVLVDKSLITLDEKFVLSMHDLVQDMGREIVRQESPLDPANRSRLWYYEDVLQVLTEGMGSEKIQGIMLDLPEKQEVRLSDQDFRKLKNLRMLIIRNAEFSGGHVHLPRNLRLLDWKEYPSPSLPSDFLPEKIVMLELRHSHLYTLEKSFKKYAYLTSLNFSSCESLSKIPDVSGIPNLEQLILEDCTSLVDIHESVGSLDKLVYLGVERCTELKNLPSVLKLPSLGCIVLNGCSQLEKFPELLGEMENLKFIEVEETAIQELPSCIINFSSLEVLVLKCCSNLKELPINIDMLPNLQLLDISGCPQLQLFTKKLRSFSTQNCPTMLAESDKGSPNIELLPSPPCLDPISPSIHLSYGFPLLENLELSDCNLSDEDLHILSCFSNLASLDISRNHFLTLPKCFNRLCSLQELYMANCMKLQHISGIPPNLEHIDATSCTRLESQSLDFLLSQGFSKAFKFEVIAPRPKMKMPFNYQSEGGSISFWIGQKFPRIALCFIFGLGNKITGFFSCEVQLSINGQKASNRVERFLSVIGDLTWLYHQDVMDFNTYLLHEQNYVEVTCEIIDASKDAEVTVYYCGVHEYKDDEDVKTQNLMLHSSSNSSDIREGNVNDSLDNTGSDCCSLARNLRLYEIPDKQWKRHPASINAEALEGDGCMAKENGKATGIMSADVVHQSKELPLLQLKQYDDVVWDPMLLECQLNSMNENPLLSHHDYHTSKSKEVGPMMVRALDSPKEMKENAFDNVNKEDLVSQKKVGLKMDNVLKEPKEEPEVPIVTRKMERELQYETKSNKLDVFPMAHNTSQFDFNDNMEEFYATLRAETFALSSLTSRNGRDDFKLAYPEISEETEKALETLKEFLSKQFHQLLSLGSFSSMKAALESLSTLSTDADVSLCLKSLLLQLSTDFDQWSCDYIDASMKLESSTAGLSKLDTLEDSLIANKNQFSEFSSIEIDLCSQLVYLEQRKKELEQQLEAIKYSISISEVTRDTALSKKRETFEEGKMLKAQRDQLRKQRPRLRSEQESAKATKANIEDEWSKIREKFDGILNIFGSKYCN
ncbi:disease resistance protein RUN1-like [Arachis stenosperma]|uniref:disease resistance protein RUN1-like n=1 Tax=Arachis stenosperma TaxID=217475 RepID=UPI0025ABE003|nr:disease resistance protein RUN1-like [Arachis stenosperma]